METVAEKPKTPLYPIPRANISYRFNLNEIDNTEVLPSRITIIRKKNFQVLRPESVASTVDSNREVSKKVIIIPETFADFRELAVELDQITSEQIEKMKEASEPHDLYNSGYLPISTLLFCIQSIIQSPSDTWQNLLDWLMATNMEEEKLTECPIEEVHLLDYQLFFEVLLNDKLARDVL